MFVKQCKIITGTRCINYYNAFTYMHKYYYVLSNEHIKIGDWIWHRYINLIDKKYKRYNLNLGKYDPFWDCTRIRREWKVIATSDPSVDMPRIPQSMIDNYEFELKDNIQVYFNCSHKNWNAITGWNKEEIVTEGLERRIVIL